MKFGVGLDSRQGQLFSGRDNARCCMLDVGCWMLDVGCWMLDFEFPSLEFLIYLSRLAGDWSLFVGSWFLEFHTVIE